MAERHGFSLAQLSIAWCLKNEAVQCTLVGPTSTQELISFLQALQVSRINNHTCINYTYTLDHG